MSAQAATAMQPAKESVPVKNPPSQDMFDRMQDIYKKISQRAFEIFNNNGKWFGHDVDDWLHAEAELLHPIHLEVTETDDNLSVRAEVPGFTAKELDIEVEPLRLVITGKHETKEETKKGKTVYSEQCAKEVFRAFDLPAEVDNTKVTATLKDGVLTVEMPKAAGAGKVQIEAKAV